MAQWPPAAAMRIVAMLAMIILLVCVCVCECVCVCVCVCVCGGSVWCGQDGGNGVDDRYTSYYSHSQFGARRLCASCALGGHLTESSGSKFGV